MMRMITIVAMMMLMILIMRTMITRHTLEARLALYYFSYSKQKERLVSCPHAVVHIDCRLFSPTFTLFHHQFVCCWLAN